MVLIQSKKERGGGTKHLVKIYNLGMARFFLENVPFIKNMKIDISEIRHLVSLLN